MINYLAIGIYDAPCGPELLNFLQSNNQLALLPLFLIFHLDPTGPFELELLACPAASLPIFITAAVTLQSLVNIASFFGTCKSWSKRGRGHVIFRNILWHMDNLRRALD